MASVAPQSSAPPRKYPRGGKPQGEPVRIDRDAVRRGIERLELGALLMFAKTLRR